MKNLSIRRQPDLTPQETAIQRFKSLSPDQLRDICYNDRMIAHNSCYHFGIHKDYRPTWFILPHLIVESTLNKKGERIMRPLSSFEPYLLLGSDVAPKHHAAHYYQEHEMPEHKKAYLEVFN
jgi:hypothetical protein